MQQESTEWRGMADRP